MPLVRFRILASAVASCALLACSGDGGGPFAPPGLPSPSGLLLKTEVSQVRDYMFDWYLFYRDVPLTVNLLNLDTAEEALEKLRVSQDRFSFVDRKSATDNFLQNNQTVAFGIGFQKQGADALIIVEVPQNSPASAGDLRRGDLILAIDGTPVSQLISEDRVSEAFGPRDPGVQRTFKIRRGTAEFDKQLTKQVYTFLPVSNAKVIESGGRKFGYLFFSSFTDTSAAEFQRALDAIKTGGAQYLVIDMRSNGGGLVTRARDVANFLVPESANGQVFWRTNYNDKHRNSNQAYDVEAAPRYAFDGVAMLTSESTCSASEELLTGLRVYRPVTTIGAKTCGKPYGFNGQPLDNDKTLFAITFVGGSRDKEADFVDGIAPDCAVNDDFSTELGTAEEKLFAGAITRLASGACPPAAAAPAAEKTLAGAAPRALEFGYRSTYDFWRVR